MESRTKSNGWQTFLEHCGLPGMAIPEHLRWCYRWGWLAFIAGLVLGLCLLLSKQ